MAIFDNKKESSAGIDPQDDRSPEEIAAEVARQPVEEQGSVDHSGSEPSSVEVELDENVAEAEAPEEVVSPHQVEPTFVIFVPFEDFEGRINQEDFHFEEGKAVKVTRDQANTWLEAKKGYVK